jgi:hypothetical protein
VTWKLLAVLALPACSTLDTVADVAVSYADGSDAAGRRLALRLDANTGADAWVFASDLDCASGTCLAHLGWDSRTFGTDVDLEVWDDVSGDELAVIDAHPISGLDLLSPDADDPTGAVSFTASPGAPRSANTADLVLALP